MRHSPFADAPVEPVSLLRSLALCAFVGLVLALVSLDTARMQVVGKILFPIEYVINAAFFPLATTPVRGNGTALLILVPTLLLGLNLFFAFRLFARIVIRALTRIAAIFK